MYKSSQISVIIPTYNRPNDLEITLKSLEKLQYKLNEIIVVDQSNNNSTKKLIKKSGIKILRYLYSKTPSITIARNLGAKNINKKAKIILFLDDDVEIETKFLNEVLRIFNNYPNAKGVGVYYPIKPLSKIDKVENVIKRIFFISYFEESNLRIISAYGNTYPYAIKNLTNCQWIPGANMAFKREILDEFKFDENLKGYTIAEDIDFTYRLYKKYQKGLFITPLANYVHRYSLVERYPTKKMSYINQIDHFYFYFKNLSHSRRNLVIFIWSLLGITLLRILKLLFFPKKENMLKLKYYLESLKYCIKNKEKIKKGELRDFNFKE